MSFIKTMKEAAKSAKEVFFEKNPNESQGVDTMESLNKEASNEVKENMNDKVNSFLNNQESTNASSMNSMMKDTMYQSTNANETDDIVKNSHSNVVIIRPKKYEHTNIIGQYLKDGRAVILTIDALDENTQVKTVEYIKGICFALNLSLIPFGQKSILIDPNFPQK